jgi:hypothetical protein
VEVILALTIFVLMGTILYGVLSLAHSAVEKSQASFEENQKLRAFEDLLGSYIRSSYPYRGSAQDAVAYYEGGEDRLVFVSAFSIALGGRGMAKITLSWEKGEDDAGVLQLTEELPVRLSVEGGAGAQQNSVVLEPRIREFRLAYLDLQEEDQWEERWDAKERRTLPRAVRLSYRVESGAEMRWTFPIMVSVLGQ